MKHFLLIACCSLTSLAGFSQTEKPIQGKVSYQDSYQKNIDVINFTTKKFTQTNTSGEFAINAKVGDVLIFMSTDFADQKYKLTQQDFEKGTVSIKLIEKPIPLEEVEIQQIKAIKASVSYVDATTAKLEKEQSRPINKDVYTGEIVNGVNIKEVGKLIGKLFKSNKNKIKAANEKITFTDYAKSNFNDSFFSKTLKLKPDEVSRFLAYCEKDPKSQTAIKSNDELTLLEFLLAKQDEFKKLQ